MKKFMTMVLAAALVFAAAGQASAAALETSGEFRGRFWYLSDYKMDGSNEFFDQRLRLNMNWKVSDTVKVGARADILENVWNTVPALGQSAEQEIDFDQAFIVFPIGASTWTVGKQDVSWGSGIYAKSDNRYRAKFGFKAGNIPVGFAYDKLNESGEWNNDDHGYTANTIIPVGGWNLGFLGVYRDNNPIDATFMGLDVTAAGALGPAKFAFEGAYGQGEQGPLDTSGLMAYLGAFLPLGPVNAGFEFGYAKGDGDPLDGDKEDVLFHDYNGAFNSFILFNNFDLDGYNSVYSGGADKGLNNAMALKASATFAFSKEFSLMGAAVWAQADEKGLAKDADMGIEFDVLAKFAATENLTLQAGFGYLAAGDYFGDIDDPMVATAHAVVAF